MNPDLDIHPARTTALARLADLGLDSVTPLVALAALLALTAGPHQVDQLTGWDLARNGTAYLASALVAAAAVTAVVVGLLAAARHWARQRV